MWTKLKIHSRKSRKRQEETHERLSPYKAVAKGMEILGKESPPPFSKAEAKEKNRLLAGFRLEASRLRFFSNFGRFDTEEPFHGAARVTLRHGEIINMTAEVVSSQKLL